MITKIDVQTKKIYNDKGEMTQEIFITYDDKKNESRETDHRRTTICQLDDHDNPVNCMTYNNEGKLIEKCWTTYDKDNKVLEKVYRTPDNEKKYVFHNEYNADGYHTKITKDDYVDFVDNMKVIYFYKDDKLPYQQSMSANGTLPAYSELSYQYDKKGNWIQKRSTLQWQISIFSRSTNQLFQLKKILFCHLKLLIIEH